MSLSRKTLLKADSDNCTDKVISANILPTRQKVLPPTYLLSALIIMSILGLLFPGFWIIPPIWNLMGLIPLISGLIINLLADHAFRQVKTTVKPFKPSLSLVTAGVYRISRNPMYLGFVLILLGAAVLLRSLTPCLIVVIFAILMDRVFITVEEEMMFEKFGSDWTAYQLRTRKWL